MDVRGCWVRIIENSEVNFHPPESLLKDSIVEEFILLMGWEGKGRKYKGGSITVPLTSCLTGLESAV